MRVDGAQMSHLTPAEVRMLKDPLLLDACIQDAERLAGTVYIEVQGIWSSL